MRQRRFRGLALSLLLAFSLSTIPLVAAPSEDGGGPALPGITRVLKQVKKFVASVLDTLTLPKP